MPTQRSEFKGFEMLELYNEGEEDQERKFKFGKKKAKLILDNIEDIKEFAQE